MRAKIILSDSHFSWTNVSKLFSLRKNLWNIVISNWISAVIYSQLELDTDTGQSQVGSDMHCSSEKQQPTLVFQ